VPGRLKQFCPDGWTAAGDVAENDLGPPREKTQKKRGNKIYDFVKICRDL